MIFSCNDQIHLSHVLVTYTVTYTIYFLAGGMICSLFMCNSGTQSRSNFFESWNGKP